MSPAPAVQSEDRVRSVAYALWLAEGQPDGRAEAHWLKAHELITHELMNAEARPVAPAKPRPGPAAAAAKKAAPRKRS